MGAIEELTDRLLPRLEGYAAALAAEVPGISARASTQRTSERAAWPRFSLFLGCIIGGDVPREQPDLIDLGITLDLRDPAPRFVDAAVCWGHPSGQVVAELPVRGVPYSEESLRLVEDGLPELVEALKRALIRGTPTQPNLFPH